MTELLSLSLLKPIPPHRFPSIRSWGPEPPPERQRSPLPLLRFQVQRFPLDWTVSYMPSAQEQSHNPYNPNALSWQAQKSSFTTDNQRLQFGSKIPTPASWTIKTTPHKLAIADLIKKDWIPRSSLKNAMKTNVSRKDRLKVCFMISKEWIVNVRYAFHLVGYVLYGGRLEVVSRSSSPLRPWIPICHCVSGGQILGLQHGVYSIFGMQLEFWIVFF